MNTNDMTKTCEKITFAMWLHDKMHLSKQTNIK